MKKIFLSLLLFATNALATPIHFTADEVWSTDLSKKWQMPSLSGQIVGTGDLRGSHATVISISPTGSDLPCPQIPPLKCGDGSYALPFRSLTRGNVAMLALSPPPSLTNVPTMWIDPGFYSEAPVFTFLDFVSYFSPVSAEGQCGVSIPDGIGGFLPIVVNMANNSQIFIWGVSTTSDITGANGSGLTINDTNPQVGGNFEAFGLSFMQITGPWVVNGAGANSTIVQALTNVVQFDPAGSTAQWNNVSGLMTGGAVFSSKIIVNADANAGNGGAFLSYKAGGVTGQKIEINGDPAGDGAFLQMQTTPAKNLPIQVDTTNSFILADAASLPRLRSKLTFNGGSSEDNNLTRFTSSYGVGFSPSDPSKWGGTSPSNVQDAFDYLGINSNFGSVLTDIVPVNDGANNVGGPSNRWNTGYFENLTNDGINGISVPHGFDMSGSFVTGLGTPVNAGDAVNKTYADSFLPLSGGKMTGLLQLPVQGLGVTPTCGSPQNGALAITSLYIGCVCNGSGWVKFADGITACVF